MRASRSFLLAGIASLSLAAAAQASPAASGPVPHPDPAMGDGGVSPFYLWDKPVPSTPGLLLRHETGPASHRLAGALPSTRILYTSLSGVGDGGPVTVSGEVFIPAGKPPAGGWPIVAWAHGTTGFADVCAPSWRDIPQRDATYLEKWLGQGYAVVATDYEGLGTPGDHPYLLWKSEAHSILDSVRAALHDRKFDLRNEVVLVGQSQGAGAALGAAWSVPHYAPDLNVRATVLTGLVTAIATATTHNKAKTYSDPTQMDAGFAMLRFAGIDHSLHPTADLRSYLSPDGKIMLQTALHGCFQDLEAEEKKLGLKSGSTMFTRSIDPIDHDMEANFTLPDGKLTMPVFVGTGLADRAAGVGGQYDAVQAMCRAGSHVVWHTYPGLSHNGTVNVSFRDSGPFASDVLQGKTEPSNCGSISAPGSIQDATPGVPFND